MRSYAIAVALLAMCLLSAGRLEAQWRLKRKPKPVMEAPPPPPVYYSVIQRPVFPGNVSEYCKGQTRYPELARDEGIQGRTQVFFEVREDGSTQILGVRQSSGNALLDSEACRVVRHMPLWQPAKYNGRPVRYRMILPVVFEQR